jgi:nucleotide-binding universal stress UspA family protein
MKNVLVLIHDDVGQEARFQAALDLTRALDGHLTCLDVAAVPLVVGDYIAMEGSAIVMADERAAEQRNRSRIQARLTAEDVAHDWVDVIGLPSQEVSERSALADVIVLNRALESENLPDMLGVAGEVVISSGKPVLAVPESARSFDAFGQALIAWDGSREAMDALRAATPLLAKASAVTILEVRDGSIGAPAEDAAEYLSRHGIKPIIRRENALMDIPSTVILCVVEEMRAAYLVMGGFGHSRFIEAAFGGVTRRMLQESPVALLLVH